MRWPLNSCNNLIKQLNLFSFLWSAFIRTKAISNTFMHIQMLNGQKLKSETWQRLQD